jgi:site-specific recombinase XerD
MSEIKQFVEYLSSVRNYSAETIRSYEADLMQFKRFLDNEMHTENYSQVTTLVIRSYPGKWRP